MAIPALVGDPIEYWLPCGTHSCGWLEVESAFTYNPTRVSKWRQLEAYMLRILEWGLQPQGIYLDGSFTTGRAEPGDVDGFLVFPPGHMDAVEKNLRRRVDQGVKNAKEDLQGLHLFRRQPNAVRVMLGVHMFMLEEGTAGFDSLMTTFTKGINGLGLRDPDPKKDPAGLVVPGEKGILVVGVDDSAKLLTTINQRLAGAIDVDGSETEEGES